MKSLLSAFLSAAMLLLMPLTARAAEPELMAALSVMGYGYKVKITVNGADVGVEGGKSENRRLFNKGHEMAAKASPAARARNFVLVPGDNEIAIEYTSTEAKPQELEVTLQAENYPQPSLKIVNKNKPSDKLVLKIRIDAKPAADFKTVMVNS